MNRMRVEDEIFESSSEELDRYPVGVITLDRQGIVLHYNRAESALSRLSPVEVVGRRFFGDVAPCTAVREFEGRFLDFAVGTTTAIERFDFSFRFAWGSQDVEITLMRRVGRSEIHVMVQTDSKHDDPGDLAARRRTLAALPHPDLDAPRIAAGILPEEASLDEQRIAYWTEDPETGTVFWSEELRALFGAGSAFVPRNGSLFRRIDPVDRERARLSVERSKTDGRPFSIECRTRRFDGSPCEILLQGVSYADASGTVRFRGGSVIDMTERNEAHRRVRHAAEHDALTGLQNRARVQGRIRDLLRGAQLVAVLFIDLDGFKRVNDGAGHAIGDRLLCMVAERIASVVDAENAARLSGDEFVAVVTGDRAENVESVADALLDTLALAYEIDDESYLLTASIGVATRRDIVGDEHVLLDAADDAMYAAKSAGKNAALRYVPAIRDRAVARESADALVRQALTDDRVEVFFQPIVDGTSYRLVGCEALVRIRRHDGSIAMPDEFIAGAERNGMIVPLGERVFGIVAATMRDWQHTELADLRVSINVAPSQFGDRRFLPFVRNVIATTGIDAGSIELELTEGLLERFDDTLRALVEMKLVGMRIAIDDFGTGYSALAYLKYFPIDTVKLDRSFVIGIGRHPLDIAIASTITQLARQLHLDVIAEGVETPTQREHLAELGVSAMQGYLFGEPMPIASFVALAKAEFARSLNIA